MPDPGHDVPEGTDLHAPGSPIPTAGTGSYQVGTAPKTLQQKAFENRQQIIRSGAQRSPQKVKSYAPGSDPSIKGRTSFSDEQGD